MNGSSTVSSTCTFPCFWAASRAGSRQSNGRSTRAQHALRVIRIQARRLRARHQPVGFRPGDQCSVQTMQPHQSPAGNRDGRRLERRGQPVVRSVPSFWEEWPPLPGGASGAAVDSVKYGHDEDKNKRISEYLDTIDFDAKPGLGGVVLPPFRELRRTDVETWIQHQRVRELFRSPEQAIGHLDVIFTEEDRTFAMQPFAEVQFPRFLDRL